MTAYWPVQILVFAAVVFLVGVAAYRLGHRHGSATRAKVLPEQQPPSAHIPAYRIMELTVLMELGVLTREEFEHEKGKIHAGRPA